MKYSKKLHFNLRSYYLCHLSHFRVLTNKLQKLTKTASKIVIQVSSIIGQSVFGFHYNHKFLDLKLLVLGQNSKQTHSSLVVDVGSDAFDLPNHNDTTQISEAVNPVVSRIQQGNLFVIL